MSQPLFRRATISMEKVAYSTRMEGEPEEWPVGVMRESYKQLPFLKSYETEVEFDKMDTSRGYAVGKMVVWPARIEKTAASEKRQLITVPLIIRDRELSPLDVYTYEGSMYPMDQEKVATILHRPQLFTGAAPKTMYSGGDLQQQLTPPNEGHQYNAGSLSKHGSAGLLKTAATYFRSEDVDKVAEVLAGDAPLRHAYTTNPILSSALGDVVRCLDTQKTASEKRSLRTQLTRATAIQIQESGNGYKVKTANHACYAPVVSQASRFDVQSALPEETFALLQRTGRITLTQDPVDTSVQTKSASLADKAGVYRVSKDGEERVGLVIPHVVDFDGHPLPMQVFAGEDSHAFQEKVAGTFVHAPPIPGGRPKGLGVFVYQDGERAFATEPVDVLTLSKTAHAHGVSETLHCKRMATGEMVRVSVVPGLLKMAMIHGEVALPESMIFLPLMGEGVRVSDTAEKADLPNMKKVAGASSVKILSGDDTYAFRGDNAAAFGNDIMELDEAEFALSAMGVPPQEASALLKTASQRDWATVSRTRRVFTEAERGVDSLQKTASVMRAARGISADLLKPLAVLAAPSMIKTSAALLTKENADTILSLNFVTPENASIYVNYLPDIEKVSSKLAEILVASRLGIDDVRESSAKNAMTQVNAVVRGLETLRDRIM